MTSPSTASHYATHSRVRMEGILGDTNNPSEIFSFGFSVGEADLAAVDDAQIVAACVGYFQRLATGISGRAYLTSVNLSSHGAGAGRQIGDTRRVQVAAGGGGGSGTQHAFQVSYRVSLGDGQRGRSHRGGWYVPLPVWTVASRGNSDQGQADAARDSAVQFANEINAAVPRGSLVIASGVLGNLPVTKVRVGNTLDTIRTRRNALVETYSVGDVTPGTPTGG